MTNDPVLEYWNQRAPLAGRAGSDDTLAKKLEVDAISKHIRSGMVVAEFGCGDATTAMEIARKHDIQMFCFDFSPKMIEEARKIVADAGLSDRIELAVCDVRDEPEIGRKFDVVYTERMIINLPDWAAQERAIRYLAGRLKPGGRFLMCENSAVGLGKLNELRQLAGLERITAPWHNKYLDDAQVSGIQFADASLVDVDQYSGTYYFLSRVVNAWLAAQEGKRPAYDAPVNQLATKLPAFGDCAQGKLWIFEKNHG